MLGWEVFGLEAGAPTSVSAELLKFLKVLPASFVQPVIPGAPPASLCCICYLRPAHLGARCGQRRAARHLRTNGPSCTCCSSCLQRLQAPAAPKHRAWLRQCLQALGFTSLLPKENLVMANNVP